MIVLRGDAKPPHSKNMSWKSEVAQIILDIDLPEFTTTDVWKYHSRLEAAFPNSNSIAVTALLTLAKLRDVGAITFVSKGRYRLTTQGRHILEEIANS